MPFSLSRWLRSLTADRLTSPAMVSPVRSARLAVESLEDRVVPALHTWTGASSFFSDGWRFPSNWDGGVPTSNEPGGTFVEFRGNTESTMDIAGLVIDQLFLTGTNNRITLNNQLSFGGSKQITSSGGTHTITGSVIIDPASVMVAPGSTLNIFSPISFPNTSAFEKDGPGVLSLQGPLAPIGTTAVKAGTLEVTPGGMLASPVALFNGGTLAGGGQVLAIGNSSGGRIAPGQGTSTQTLTLTGNSLNNLNNVTYQPTITGANSDRISVVGALSLTGAVLSPLSLAPPTAVSYTLIDNAGTTAITGTFNGLPEGAFLSVAGQTYRISYVGGTGNDVTLTRGTPPVPPPAPLPVPAPPAFSGAQVTGNTLVLTGASVPNGAQAVPLPPGSFALFADLTGDAQGDVILFLPTLTVVVDGQTGRLVLLDADDNGDGARDLKIFNSDGTTTRIDGRTGIALTF